MNNLDFQVTVKGLEVSFMINSKVPAETTFDWDFGDDTESVQLKQPVHVYEKPGFYTVTLQVKSRRCGYIQEIQKLIILSTVVKTRLTDSIYHLIDRLIPEELSKKMDNDDKSLYINKWQLYIYPLVDRSSGEEIPIEEYNNELYYEGLENQLIMELAAWDYLNVEILKVLTSTANYLRELNSNSSSGEDDPDDSGKGERIKKIQTGPTEVEYYDSLSESNSSLFKAYSQLVKPGGFMDELRKNLCMLAQRINIYLPFCSQPYSLVIPDVVNRRDPGILGGPNPTAPINTYEGVTYTSKRRK
jgi:PKD repeat protein